MSNARTMLTLGSAPWNRARHRHRVGAGRARVEPRGLGGATVPYAGDTQIWDHDQEPDLDSLLNDPIVGLVMTRDGLSPDDVARYVRCARERLAATAA